MNDSVYISMILGSTCTSWGGHILKFFEGSRVNLVSTPS